MAAALERVGLARLVSSLDRENRWDKDLAQDGQHAWPSRVSCCTGRAGYCSTMRLARSTRRTAGWCSPCSSTSCGCGGAQLWPRPCPRRLLQPQAAHDPPARRRAASSPPASVPGPGRCGGLNIGRRLPPRPRGSGQREVDTGREQAAAIGGRTTRTRWPRARAAARGRGRERRDLRLPESAGPSRAPAASAILANPLSSSTGRARLATGSRTNSSTVSSPASGPWFSTSTSTVSRSPGRSSRALVQSPLSAKRL